MSEIVDLRILPSSPTAIPGWKPPVFDFLAIDDLDPNEVDAFNQMIRELRNQSPAVSITVP